jgi:hypothetical protein
MSPFLQLAFELVVILLVARATGYLSTRPTAWLNCGAGLARHLFQQDISKSKSRHFERSVAPSIAETSEFSPGLRLGRQKLGGELYGFQAAEPLPAPFWPKNSRHTLELWLFPCSGQKTYLRMSGK